MFQTTPIPAEIWLFGSAFGVALLLLEEARKALVRVLRPRPAVFP